ncbi:TolC family protein [Paludisphaera rhizosphaerae]|uniref:TolC family protein n=1 Tax=Paludisphaera rhizosphaerae TaxID=2711216 RepID=UPI0013EA4B7D|nr:TolC family protein [Paludisphaera rhizosphaerae]
MNQSASSATTKHERRAGAIASAILCGFLLVLPSCGIPDRREPMPGPDLPEKFDVRKANATSDLPDVFEASSGDNSAQVQIEEFYGDPLLTGLMHQAVLGNQEMRVLAEEVQIASNEIFSRSGTYLPFLFLGGGAGTDKPSLYTRAGAVDSTLNILPGVPIPTPLPDFVMGPTFFWTPDIWRQLHNARDAAAMRYFATAEGRSFSMSQLLAEIADNYYELMALDNRLEILDQTIALMEQSLEVAKALKEAARGTELGVLRFLAEVQKNQSEKLIVKQQIIETENRINFLVGRFPQPVERSTADFIDLSLHTLGVGIPSQLLQNRPDIRQAERQIAATGLDVKVARKAFLPVLTVTAGVGYEAFNPRYILVTPEALIANVVGNMIGPLVNKRAIQADFMNADARQLQALYNYQRVVINAFTEIVNRLSKVENYRESIEIKKHQLEALEGSVETASKLFQNARAEYMDVLFAQRDLRDARTVLVETKQQQLSAVVNTYQALGGGAYLSPVPPPSTQKVHDFAFPGHVKH